MCDISEKIAALKEAKYKLLLIVGEPGTGKSKLINEYAEKEGYSILDLNTIFGEEVPEGSDSQYLIGFMNGYLSTYKKDILLLDNKRVLYSKNSQIDLLSFLKAMATSKIVVATWNGRIENGKLIHIRSKLPENLVYPLEDIQCEYIVCE